VKRGSWFAKQGSGGLQCGSVLPGVASFAGRKLAGEMPVPVMWTRSRAHDPEVDTVNDTLDDLLSHAQATLQKLDYLRARAALQGSPCARGPCKSKCSADNMGFWQPRCQAHLWAQDLDFGSGTSSSSEDSGAEDADWSFLKSVAGFHKERYPERTPVTSRQVPAASQASNPRQRTRTEFPQKAVPRSNAVPANEAARQQSKEIPPNPKIPRGNVPGFQFGSAGKGRGSANAQKDLGAAARVAQTPTADCCVQVTLALEGAKCAGGQECRRTLRQLLLQWHPDKAPQGQDPTSVAARQQATEVLRFILQERDRLSM